MRDDLKLALKVLCVFAMFGIAVVGTSYVLDRSEAATCETDWSGSGIKYAYKPHQGCMIQLRNGEWISAGAYKKALK